jgi:signal transduction histidine kinase
MPVERAAGGTSLVDVLDRVLDKGIVIERHLLYSIINAVTDPILLTDATGKLLVGNTRAEDLFAAREDQSEGRRRAVELNNLFFSSALASRMVGPSATAREVVLVDPEDGSDLLFELLTSSIGSDNKHGAVVSVLRNVTDLWRARQELEENYHRLRITEASMRTERNRLDLVVDAVVDPIIVTNPGGDILMTNVPAEHYFTVPAGAGSTAQLHVQANVAKLSSFVSGLLLSGPDRRARERVVLTDPVTGRSVPMEAVAGTKLESQGELTGVVTVLHDQTETIERELLYSELQHASAQLEQRVREATAELAAQNELLRRQALDLEQASDAKSQFLANVSHEFRTPLNAILGYSTMMLGGFYGMLTEEQQRTVSRIDANSKHLATLINDVLDVERIEAGKMPIAVAPFGLDDLVKELLEELEGVIAQSPVPVFVSLPADVSVPVRSDRQKVKQILANLLTNALKFTRAGRVDIIVKQDLAGNSFAVAVRDTGIGISPADLTRIFEPFQQANRATSRALGGTGLGLAICRKLAQILGGEIRVESELGVGSTFTVELPLRVRARTASRRGAFAPDRRLA